MMVNVFGEHHKHKKWSTGYKWAYTQLLGCSRSMWIWYHTGQNAKGSASRGNLLFCVFGNNCCLKGKLTVAPYRRLQIAHSPRSNPGKVIGQEELPQHFALVLLLFASSTLPKNYTIHCFCFQPGWQEHICSLQQVPSQVNKVQTMQ